MIVNTYVDGFNLYHALDRLGDQRVKWLDHWKLAAAHLRPEERLGQVYFFTAVVTWDRAKQQRHTSYLRALRAVGVQVEESNFRKQPKTCFDTGRRCNFREEKKTDVAISAAMLSDAMMGRCDRMVLITSDSDQVPTINAIRANAPRVELTLIYPPREKKEATELGGLFTGKNRKELKPSLLHRCLLPQDVYGLGGSKVATRPAVYGQP